ncbi:hypothetical protein GQ55_7G205000 [Panicum hallii var. hallii]|uniref:Uncharacterized protein n=1 Tax=Panicum hallii var. hallii TaxID=1504633 RepID=A0A2T7CX74_9POAL|nr:hypothetical protein GQ55_7G205000 [Panicum hallii var. hallii]
MNGGGGEGRGRRGRSGGVRGEHAGSWGGRPTPPTGWLRPRCRVPAAGDRRRKRTTEIVWRLQ